MGKNFGGPILPVVRYQHLPRAAARKLWFRLARELLLALCHSEISGGLPAIILRHTAAARPFFEIRFEFLSG